LDPDKTFLTPEGDIETWVDFTIILSTLDHLTCDNSSPEAAQPPKKRMTLDVPAVAVPVAQQEKQSEQPMDVLVQMQGIKHIHIHTQQTQEMS
jgi:hypothetical protein